MKNTVHSLRIKYDPSSQTYSGALVIKQYTPSKTEYYKVFRKHDQTVTSKKGRIRVVEHRHAEAVPFQRNPRYPLRGTRAWKELRKQ